METPSGSGGGGAGGSSAGQPNPQMVVTAMAELHHKEQITDLLMRQFMYVDERRWDRLRQDVFVAGPLVVDTSAGLSVTTAEALIRTWEEDLAGVTAVCHEIGAFTVEMEEHQAAHAVAMGSATHFRAGATQGQTRTFKGKFEFDLLFHPVNGWRICGLKFTASFIDGNLNLA